MLENIRYNKGFCIKTRILNSPLLTNTPQHSTIFLKATDFPFCSITFFPHMKKGTRQSTSFGSAFVHMYKQKNTCRQGIANRNIQRKKGTSGKCGHSPHQLSSSVFEWCSWVCSSAMALYWSLSSKQQQTMTSDKKRQRKSRSQANLCRNFISGKGHYEYF